MNLKYSLEIYSGVHSVCKFKTNSLENSQTLEIHSHEKLGRYFRKRILADFRVYTTGVFFFRTLF